MFCRTSANFGIAYPLPILGKVLLLVDPSEGRAWCTWAVLPSSAWVMNKRAVVWPESRGRLGRAHRLCEWFGEWESFDLGERRAIGWEHSFEGRINEFHRVSQFLIFDGGYTVTGKSHRPSSLTPVLHGAAASHGPCGSQSSWLEPRPLVPNWEGQLQIRFGPPGVSVDSECPGGEGRGEGGILASRINAWHIGQCHGHLETLSCASAKPGNF
ncbi:hypothetical protein H8957_015141 [Semnopithecus entellus]